MCGSDRTPRLCDGPRSRGPLIEMSKPGWVARGTALALGVILSLPAAADTIDDFQQARRDKIMRELELKSGPDPRNVLQNVQPTAQEIIPVYKGSYGSANNVRDRYVLLAYERKTLEARLNDVLPGGWQVIEIGLSYAKIQKGGVTRFLDVKLPETTFPRGLNPSIFQPIN